MSRILYLFPVDMQNFALSVAIGAYMNLWEMSPDVPTAVNLSCHA